MSYLQCLGYVYRINQGQNVLRAPNQPRLQGTLMAGGRREIIYKTPLPFPLTFPSEDAAGEAFPCIPESLHTVCVLTPAV